MIISPPFLPQDQSSETAFLDAAMSLTDVGFYPVSHSLQWHNGLHLQAPRGATGAYLPVCAVADSEVLYVVPPDAQPSTDKNHPQNHAAFGQGPEWTDKGMVIVRHRTEIGANGSTATEVVFYSVYMHLKSLRAGITPGARIYRKDPLGEAGQIYGHAGQIHFEICCDQANLQKFLGTERSLSWQSLSTAPSANGRTDAVFGSLYVYLPASTPTSATQPSHHLRTSDAAPTLGAAQWVQLTYASGSAQLSSYTAEGVLIGQRHDPNAEYTLYEQADKRHKSLTDAQKVQSSPSGWYELLRFGRVLGVDPLPHNAAHWRQIVSPAGEVWVDLNAPGTCKFSDADFPAVMGWQCIDDDGTPDDQRCDSANLKRLILSDTLDPAERAAILKSPQKLSAQTDKASIKAKLSHTICKFPSEFDQGTLEARYGWIKDSDDFKDSPDNWDKLNAHIRALTRADLPQAYKDAQWHFDPKAFIAVMRRCGWLSKGEFKQMIPVNVIRHQKVRNQVNQIENRYHWEPVGLNQTLLNSQHLPLNCMMRKYGINTATRKAAFWGNAIQETSWFRVLEEQHANGYWYYPWHGRGYLQLTLPSNYIQYWRWLGRSVPATLETALNNAAAAAKTQNSNAGLRDVNFPALTQEMSDQRGYVAGIPPTHQTDAPADSAGFYWEKTSMAQYADQTHVLERQAVNTQNDGQKAYYRSPAFWQASAAVNLPSVIESLYDTRLNGFVDRCCAYAQVLAVTGEASYPTAAGSSFWPDPLLPRRN